MLNTIGTNISVQGQSCESAVTTVMNRSTSTGRLSGRDSKPSKLKFDYFRKGESRSTAQRMMRLRPRLTPPEYVFLHAEAQRSTAQRRLKAEAAAEAMGRGARPTLAGGQAPGRKA